MLRFEKERRKASSPFQTFFISSMYRSHGYGTMKLLIPEHIQLSIDLGECRIEAAGFAGREFIV